MDSQRIVYKGYDSENGIEVFWNSINLKDVEDKTQNNLISNLKQLERIGRHQNFLNILKIDINKDNKQINLITEISNGEIAKRYIRKLKSLKLKIFQKWIKQILKGLQFLHKNGIVHGSLSSDSIFINSNDGKVKIGSLGLRALYSKKGENTLTMEADIYAFGVCILELIFSNFKEYQKQSRLLLEKVF